MENVDYLFMVDGDSFVRLPPLSRTFLLICAFSVLAVFITLFVLATAVPGPSPGEPLPPLAYSWAKFLGISAAIFASIQYAPQLLHTYRSKLVGALSIPMMCIQTPGGVLMVLSIALRPGTNWTSQFLFLRVWTLTHRSSFLLQAGSHLLSLQFCKEHCWLCVFSGGSGNAIWALTTLDRL